jgi:hypothetical protein|tara:strand:- start:9305 stop:9559 length:255 start_codon:yes stop_codon:yes gene_type:complete
MSFDFRKTARSWILNEGPEDPLSEEAQLRRLIDLIENIHVVRTSDKVRKKNALQLIKNFHQTFNNLTEQKQILEKQIQILEERE